MNNEVNIKEKLIKCQNESLSQLSAMQPTTVLDATVSSEKITTSEINEVVIRYYLDTRYYL